MITRVRRGAPQPTGPSLLALSKLASPSNPPFTLNPLRYLLLSSTDLHRILPPAKSSVSDYQNQNQNKKLTYRAVY